MAAAARPLLPPHPLLAALARAPVGAPFTPEQRAQMDEIREGRTRLVRHEDRDAWRSAHAGEFGDSDE
jgi:hypothetical protein